nr:uncharacterized protein LOC111419624 [Onthophagus taurus]
MTDAAVGSSDVKEEKKSFFSINKNLIALKLSLFFLYGATSSLLPYLTLHMQSIGLTIKEISAIYLALPCTTFLAPSVTGFLVDKFGKYKPVVIVAFILNAALHHALFLIPHQETPGSVPKAYVMRHPERNFTEVWWSPCASRECPSEENINIELHMCVNRCLLKPANTSTANASTTAPKLKYKKVFENETTLSLNIDMYEGLRDPSFQMGMPVAVDQDNNTADYTKNFNETLLLKYGVNVTELYENDIRCGGIIIENTEVFPGECIVHKCRFLEGGPDMCPPEFKESDDKTFWLYFGLRFLASTMMTAGVTIMDPIALTMIEKYGGDFGKEKLFSSIGMAIFSPVTGAFIDYRSKGLGYTDYSTAFYAYDVLLLISAVMVFLMPLGTKIPADNIFKDLANIVKMPNVILFIVFLFGLGNLWGFIESFLFFYLIDLGAPTYLLGITVTVGTISSMPFLYGAERITKKVGHVNVVIIAFFAHAGRLMGYSLIDNPWWCFPFEAMESLSVHLMWVAAATYCAILAPKSLLATLIGVAGMAHFSIGKGSGTFFGGQLIELVGIRQAFRYMGLGAMISGLSYAVLHFLWLRKFDEIDEEEEEETERLKDPEPKFKDQGTMVSMERLSLMIEYNQIGSLTSLGRTRSSSVVRRSSSGAIKFRGSASKVDLIKSTMEVNNRNSNPQFKNSTGYLSRNNSTKLYDYKPSSLSKLTKSASNPVSEDILNKNLIPDETDEIIYDNTINKVIKKIDNLEKEKRNEIKNDEKEGEE